MVRDKALDIFLMLFFAATGAIILVLAWVRPMPESERVFSTFIGSAGIFGVVIRALVLKSAPAGNSTTPVPEKVQSLDKT